MAFYAWLTKTFDFWDRNERAKGKSKRDPKAFMNQEKNLLDWMSRVVVFAVAGVTLLSSGSSSAKWGGFALVVVTIAFITYLVLRFRKRKQGLRTGFLYAVDDTFTPFVFIFLLVTLVIIATVYSFINPTSGVGVSRRF